MEFTERSRSKISMEKDNPFLDEDKEEKIYIPKPYQKETPTTNQKTRNLKGIKMVQDNLKKVKGRKAY